MDSFQRDIPRDFALPATLLRKGNGWVFYLIFMFAIAVSTSGACDNESNDHDCLHMNISVEEGQSVEVHLNTSGLIEDICIWNNTMSVWENACHFTHRVCHPLLPYFREDVSIKGNKFELKNAGHQASGLYRLLNSSGNCMASMQISVLSARPTPSSPHSGTFNIRLAKWSGVAWLCTLATIPILASFNYL